MGFGSICITYDAVYIAASRKETELKHNAKSERLARVRSTDGLGVFGGSNAKEI